MTGKGKGGRPAGSKTAKLVRMLRSVEPGTEKPAARKPLKKKEGEGGGGRA
jgi:hypothetical protein